MSTKLKDVAKQLDAATRELAKEQQDWKIAKGQLQRDKIKLTAVNRDLVTKNNDLALKRDELTEEVDLLRIQREKLKKLNTLTEVENSKLDDELTSVRQELANVRAELASAKASLDKDLEEYAVTRKQEIKQSILQVNEELVAERAALAVIQDQVQARKDELVALNEAAISEQAELKVSNTDTEQQIADNKARIEELQAEVDEWTEKRNKIAYQHDMLQISVAKAQKQHDNFVEYERKARIILDTKDKELQNKSADIVTQGQFLKNSRSFLSEL